MSSEKEAEESPEEEPEAAEPSGRAGAERPPRQSGRRSAEQEELGEEVGVLTISLRRAWEGSRPARTPRAVRIIRRAATRYLKPENPGDLRLSEDLNRVLWPRGRTRPPRRVRVRIFKNEDGTYTLRPVEVT